VATAPAGPRRPIPTSSPATRTRAADELWVQVLAVRHRDALDQERRRLVELGFPLESQVVTPTAVAGGATLYKLRIGPFPDRVSADRVTERMRVSGFPDAWVVVP
jgi:hypothetical protein